MFKNLFFISLICIVFGCSLGQFQVAQAEEVAQPTIFPFTHVYGEPLSVSASNFIPEIDDEVIIFFYLPVTEEMLDEMQDAVTQGSTPAIDFQTRGIIEVTGDGSGGYSAQVFAAIEHADGTRTLMETVKVEDYKQGGDIFTTPKIIHSEQAAAVSNGTAIYVEKTERYIAPLDDWLDSMQVGDTLVVGGIVEGWASSGFESGDSVKVYWRIDGDPDRPIVTGSLVSVGSD